MKKIFSLLTLLCAVLSLSAQTKVDGVWYSLYDNETRNDVVVGSDIHTYNVADYAGTELTFDYKKFSGASINGKIKVFADGTEVAAIDNKSTTWKTATVTIPAGTKKLRFNMAAPGTGASIRNVRVPLLPPTIYGEDVVASTCDNEPYEFDGNFYTESASAITLSQKNIYGGDSIVALNLTVLPTYSFEDEAIVITEGDEIFWRERALNEYVAGTYTLYDSLQTELGCDSVIYVQLTVNPAITTGLPAASAEVQACKMLRNGELIIRRGDELYFLDGRRRR